MQSDPKPLLPEEGLDPQDWSAMRSLGHRMVDDIFDYWQIDPRSSGLAADAGNSQSQPGTPLPLEPQAPEQVYQDFRENVLPYPMGNIHPRFWGWVIGTGTPLGALAEFLGAAMNPNMGGGDHVANYVEAQVIEWIKQMLAYPAICQRLTGERRFGGEPEWLDRGAQLDGGFRCALTRHAIDAQADGAVRLQRSA